MNPKVLHWYWRIFNFLARRILASGFMLVGGLVALFNVPAVLPGGTINVNGTPSGDMFFRVVSVLLPLVVGILGIALFRSQPYYPRETNSQGNDT
jgi:hypothetical protein